MMASTEKSTASSCATLHMVGLGLGSETDITVSALEAVKGCKKVYLDAYTSELPGVSRARLEELYGRAVELGHREVVESDDDPILKAAEHGDVAFLVVGDPFGATTHTDLALRAKRRGINVCVHHNASILNAVGCTGLQLYNFGRTISIVFFDEDKGALTSDGKFDPNDHSEENVSKRIELSKLQRLPTSWYDRICANQRDGMHTLCLLDIKIREQSVESMVYGRNEYLPPRYMSVSQALLQIQQIESAIKAVRPEYKTIVPIAIGLARVGSATQVVMAGSPSELYTRAREFGGPLHSLIVPGMLHEHERDYLRQFAVDPCTFDSLCDQLPCTIAPVPSMIPQAHSDDDENDY